MPHRSSTSSSEPSTAERTLDLRRLRPTGVLWALAFLLAFELLVARSEWFWTVPERSTSGVFHVLESRVMPRRPEPRIVFAGSSRTRDAVLPSEVERELSLAPGAVVNLGLTAGSPLDVRELLRRRPGWFGRGDVLVVGVEDWWFLRGRALHEREARFATIRELREPQDGIGARALGEKALRTLPAARRIVSVLAAGPRVLRPVGLDEHDRVSWRARNVRRGPAVVDVTADVARYYGDGAPGSVRAEALRDLVREARELGLRVVLVQVPWRTEYVRTVRERHPAAWEGYGERLRALAADEGVPLLAPVHGQEIAIPDVLFRDFGHLTDDGARRFSTWVADRLRAVGAAPEPR